MAAGKKATIKKARSLQAFLILSYKALAHLADTFSIKADNGEISRQAE